MSAKKKIEGLYDKKLIHQFRKGDWPNKISEDLQIILSISESEAFIRGKDRGKYIGYDNGHKDGRDQMKDAYNVSHIKKPIPTLRNRIKFLIYGKF